MNNLYFACGDCKIYTNAGYRWAYWELMETGIVSRGERIDVDTIFSAKSYWNPPIEDSQWLYEEVFPLLQRFLSEHKTHQIVFGEDEDFAPDDDYFDVWTKFLGEPR